MLKYRYQQGGWTDRFVPPWLHRKDILVSVAKEVCKDNLAVVLWKGLGGCRYQYIY